MYVVCARRPATPNQLSTTVLASTDNGLFVSPAVTSTAQQLLNSWAPSLPNGYVLKGYTAYAGIPGGSALGQVDALIGGPTQSPPYTLHTNRPVGIKIQAVYSSTYRSATLGATGKAVPDWQTIGHVAEAALTAATGLFAVGGIVVPQLRLASLITGGAQMFVKGVNNICQALVPGQAPAPLDEQAIVTVYHTSDIFIKTDFSNPAGITVNNTLQGISNTISSIRNTNYSAKPTGSALGLLDVLSQAIKLVGAFSDAGGTIKDQLLDLIQGAIDGVNGSAMDALMSSWGDALDAMTADLTNRANNDPGTDTGGADSGLIDSITAISDLMKPDAVNVWTQNLFPRYFSLDEGTGANLAEVLVNNPFPGTNPIPPYVPD